MTALELSERWPKPGRVGHLWHPAGDAFGVWDGKAATAGEVRGPCAVGSALGTGVFAGVCARAVGDVMTGVCVGTATGGGTAFGGGAAGELAAETDGFDTVGGV